jgi:hypothetical protein
MGPLTQLVLGAALGAILSILITVWVARLYRPSLLLSIDPPLDLVYEVNAPAKKARHLRLRLHNEALPWYARWTVRAPAQQCRGEITFHQLSGEPLSSGDKMPVRWVNSPQPVSLPIVSRTSRTVEFEMLDIGRMTSESRIDIYAGESELLDIAVRFDDEQDCFGWNNEAYFHQWRNPKWQFPRSVYLARVIVRSSGHKCEGLYRLFNDPNFHLEPAKAGDVVKQA